MNTKSASSTPEFGLWLFILADLCIFAMYFGVFAWEKGQLSTAFALGKDSLNLMIGSANTIILLVSSYFMATAVQHARSNNLAQFKRMVSLTLACGILFLVLKTFEYSEKFNAGYHIATNAFYRNYFAFTGFHMVHVIIGLGLLIHLRFSINESEQIEPHQQHIEGAAIYWHMVDLLWVLLFSLIYLVP